MTSKDRMLSVLNGEKMQTPPVVLHSWGDYKVEFAGYHPKFQYFQGGEELAGIERTFYERFQPDWMHFGSAGWRGFWARPRRVEGGCAFIRSEDGTRWIEVRDDYSLDDRNADPSAGVSPRLRLDSKALIDDYFTEVFVTEEEVLASGRFEHLKRVAGAYGDRVLIAMNDGLNGLPGISFEECMLACTRDLELVAYAVFMQCNNFLPVIRAAKASGAHAYILSEGLGGSLGLVSPRVEERVQGDAKRWLYTEIRKTGLLPIGYWLGDVRPHMRLINSLAMSGLMIEEDKKGFTLDPVEIRRMLRPEICLFGNVDSNLLLSGTPEAIRAEVHRQNKAAAEGPFVLANGSPLVIGTPPENIDVFIKEARK